MASSQTASTAKEKSKFPDLGPVGVNVFSGGTNERNISWRPGRQHYAGYGVGKAAQDYSIPIQPDLTYPSIREGRSKFYSDTDARKRLDYAESEDYANTVKIENGICELCKSIFEDEEGKKGFKVFMWHEDVFRMVRSSRLGCGVCRVLGQTVKEYMDGEFFIGMGGASGWLCIYLEDWIEERGERRRMCYVTWTLQARAQSLWKFDGVWLFDVEMEAMFADPEKCEKRGWRENYPLLSENSREALDLAKSWLERCESSHEACSSRRKDWCPTRLIYVGGDIIRLQTDIQSPVKYATLSHCWGKLHITRLETNNITQLLESVPESALCKTFLHAIEITRFLGLEYLWIDSLCIIQNDSEDWGREAALMADVYGQSTISIAASGAVDGSEGCFFDRDRRYFWNTPLDIDEQTLMMANTQVFERCVRHTELSKRAWVLQERLLAPRTLHFSRAQVFWECKQANACESYPNGHPNFLDMNWHLDGFRKDGVLSWEKIVQLYSRCSLTFEKDKLPALMGIAKMFQEETNMTYLVGMWKEELRLMLTWRFMSDSGGCKTPRPVEPRAPSWSWVGLESPNAPIILPELRDIEAQGRAFWHVEVIDADATLMDTDRQTWRGVLELNCEKIVNANTVYIGNLSSYDVHRAHSKDPIPSSDTQVDWDFLEDQKANKHETDHFMVPFCSNTNEEGTMQVEGLILEHVGTIPGQYKRVARYLAQKENVKVLERLFENYEVPDSDFVRKQSWGDSKAEGYVINII